MTKNAEWWVNECGGVLCSNCGLFYDDYYERPPVTCERCGSIMTEDTCMMVDKDYRLSRIGSLNCTDISEYPDWLLKLRLDHMSKLLGVIESMEQDMLF